MRPPATTHQAIRQAALRLFAERGFAATGIRDLAEAVGVTSAALYNHIGTKDELLVEIMVESLETLDDLAVDALEDVASPLDRLGRLVQTHVVVHAAFAERCRVMDTEVRSLRGADLERVVALRDRYEQRWATAIDDVIASGSATVADTGVARRALLAMCTGVDTWFRPGGSLTVDAVATAHVDLVLAALDVRRGRRPVRARDLSLTPFSRFRSHPWWPIDAGL